MQRKVGKSTKRELGSRVGISGSDRNLMHREFPGIYKDDPS